VRSTPARSPQAALSVPAAFVTTLALCALAAVGSAAQASGQAQAAGDGVALQLTKSAAGGVDLAWTGGQPPFRVHRGASVPPSSGGDTAARAWSDPASAEPLVFYAIEPIALDVTLAVSPTGGAVVGGVLYPSSTRLLATWSPTLASLTTVVDHGQVVATESLTGSSRAEAAGAADSSAEVGSLRSETPYSVVLRACFDAACSQFTDVAGGVASGATPQEAWQLQGTGSSTSGLTHIVPDGNVKIHAFRYGADAPASLAGRVQIYYGPAQMAFKGLAVGAAAAPATTDVSTVSSFTSLAGSAGLITPPTAAPLVAEVATGQAVPLTASAGGLVRFYFEARGADGKTRIMSVDSRDGWAGRDFNANAPTTCSTTADYSSGGGCQPAVAVGVAGDMVAPNAGITNARQFKIGYPTLDDWRWNMAPGTFMLFTTDPVAGCSASSHNHVFASWTGSAWQVQRFASGCPKLFTSMQAAAPLHLGAGRYKILFGDPSITTGRIPGAPAPFLGPKRLLYADAAATGDPANLEFEDFEPRASARGTTFLWPSGVVLNDAAEGYIDDFVLVSPTGDPDFQVLYVAITEGFAPPFAGLAVLVNP